MRDKQVWFSKGTDQRRHGPFDTVVDAAIAVRLEESALVWQETISIETSHRHGVGLSTEILELLLLDKPTQIDKIHSRLYYSCDIEKLRDVLHGLVERSFAVADSDDGWILGQRGLEFLSMRRALNIG